MPAGLVTLPDVAGGGQDLAEVGPAVRGEAGGAQRFEREGLVVEQELHRRFLTSCCVTVACRGRACGMAPTARRPSMSSIVNPSCFRTSSLCSPRSGARRAGTFGTSRTF